ncbi:MAG TPA: 3-oxoadipate enol-lactonase [Xanthobacteraceae bacterium]|nr:3-oxoadipate enol-lactonase [Xanthobacteraceae bacterium]
MPMIQSNGARLNAQIEGPEGAPVLMLCNSLGTDLHMWDDQVGPLTGHFRLLRYDRRGHGKSDAPKGPYDMDMLGGDALAVMDGMGVEKVHWCGLSMGGMVGMWLGGNASHRIDRLVLSNTSSFVADKQIWNQRFNTVRTGGMAAIADGTMERWFTKGFRERAPQAVARLREMVINTPVEGYIGCGEAVRDMDHRELIREITAPTMIIAGRHDPGTTVTDAEYIRDRITGSKLVVLDAAHISNVEQAQAYTDALLGFLGAK